MPSSYEGHITVLNKREYGIISRLNAAQATFIHRKKTKNGDLMMLNEKGGGEGGENVPKDGLAKAVTVRRA